MGSALHIKSPHKTCNSTSEVEINKNKTGDGIKKVNQFRSKARLNNKNKEGVYCLGKM